ncbi:bucentaur or craniofacial development-domain-containing protein [Armillaria novae-zelandiae]|uniref:SWR1-complex protein 5 n=1 Tax=Armillaria novae-zelandiae TaxID=153914 RepID=A0AA39PEJ3_9AGAR|nr:bucentaur or craniofacial development-domain-containing protein [Armillaria novae-zelandiae]
MPTTKDDSDSEDEDYVLPAGDADTERESKRQRTSSPKPVAGENDDGAQKRARDALWADFQTSLASTSTTPQQEVPKKMVKVEKRYLFAGENVVEVVEVPEDSADARKWPLFSESTEESPGANIESPPVVSGTSTPVPPKKKPGPRKGKLSLKDLPGPSKRKPKLLTTLDKSAMDWRSHVSAEPSGIKDELEANRRGGGYLEKIEFLERVGERREEALEASKSNKRRRG